MTSPPSLNVSIIGLGAMGSGMARSLLSCPSITSISAFDLNLSSVEAFYSEAGSKSYPRNFQDITDKQRLDSYIDNSTDVVVLALLNEAQCESIIFNDGPPHHSSLVKLMKPGAVIVVTSTVSASWSISANERLSAHSKQLRFIDAPISGGAIRAATGELTIMASGEDGTLDEIDPIFRAMGKEIHHIHGGVGMGSTVKIIHQILAGVHVVVAAEAIAMAAKAGLDVKQFYDIVTGAAGNSWMFGDRGQRMMEETKQVKSALDIMVKDLDIVCKEAKRLGMPVPLSAMALQQFMGGVGMGLGREDDSSVVKVYEMLGGVSVSGCTASSASKEGDDVGDFWVLPNGMKETILEVADEDRHNVVISNEYTRVLKVKFPPNDTTLAHRHAEDSLYFFLVEGGLNVLNHVKGSNPKCDCMEFGEVRYGTHKTDKPLVHKITNVSEVDMFCIDAEVLKSPPVTNPLPLVAEHHELIKTRDKCRIYKLSLEPGKSVSVSYPFFYLSVVLKGGKIKIGLGREPHLLSWEKNTKIGDEEWCGPTLDVTIENTGESVFEQFIAEWR
jgi:putative dehydrogenase